MVVDDVCWWSLTRFYFLWLFCFVVWCCCLVCFWIFRFSGATVFGKGVGEFGVHGQRHSNRRDQASGGKDTELD